MRASLTIVRVTLKQLLGGRRLLVLGLLGLIPAVVVWLGTSRRTAESVVEVFHEGALPTLLLIVVPIASIVLGSAALGDERRDGTLSFLVVRPIRRGAIAAAKFTAAWIAAAVVSIGAGALASAAASIRASDWATMTPTLVGLVVAAGCYTAVFTLLGHATSRAVLIGLVFLFVWETGISSVAPSLANVSLFRIGLTAYVGMLPESAPALADPLGSLAPGLGGALAKLSVIAAVSIGAAASLLRRRDIS